MIHIYIHLSGVLVFKTHPPSPHYPINPLPPAPTLRPQWAQYYRYTDTPIHTYWYTYTYILIHLYIHTNTHPHTYTTHPHTSPPVPIHNTTPHIHNTSPHIPIHNTIAVSVLLTPSLLRPHDPSLAPAVMAMAATGRCMCYKTQL
jgi:hypothetical protein